ncbi:DUF4338 domain-containing protein [candidate division KSB1 bacterium]|nr:DUF4338 domain-containing protein [candidate division KSB1 bacterium]
MKHLHSALIQNTECLTFSSADENSLQTKSAKEKVVLLILRDLMRLNWSVNYLENRIEVIPPESYDKASIRDSMAFKRREILNKNEKWIDQHIDLAKANLANGYDVLESKIQPVIEVCKKQKQHDLFRIYRYFWSSPYSEYVGRRIKLIVRDAALPNKPVIGIAALGSPIIHIPQRDDWIGWDKETRTENINYTMDAYVIGALPPYNYLLGGKLISYILASKEIRDIFSQKYSYSKYNKLAGIFTTSLYGKSSQYNRVRIKNRLLYRPIGETKGYGTLHLTNETFNAMNDYLKKRGIIVSNQFGDGPIWSMRVIRNAGELLGFNADVLLRHSFKRKIYFVPLAKNTKQFLNGHAKNLKYDNFSLNTLVNHWKKRWLAQRKKNNNIIENVKWFNREIFEV